MTATLLQMNDAARVDHALRMAAAAADLDPEAVMRRLIQLAVATASVHRLEGEFAAATTSGIQYLVQQIDKRSASV